MSSHSNVPRHRSHFETKGQSSLPSITCNYCKKSGHLISDCLKLKDKQQRDDVNQIALITTMSKPQSCTELDSVFDIAKRNFNNVVEVHAPYLLKGFVSLSSDVDTPTPVLIYFDTGADQSLILADTLPFSETSFSGTCVLCQGVGGGCFEVPLHNIFLESDVLTGFVTVGVKHSFTKKGVHLILGNDLVRGKVVVDPPVTGTSSFKPQLTCSENRTSHVHPSCAVTHSMASNAILNSQNKEFDDLSSTVIGDLFNHQVITTSIVNSSVKGTDFSATHTSLFDEGQRENSRSNCIQELHIEPESFEPLTFSTSCDNCSLTANDPKAVSDFCSNKTDNLNLNFDPCITFSDLNCFVNTPGKHNYETLYFDRILNDNVNSNMLINTCIENSNVNIVSSQSCVNSNYFNNDPETTIYSDNNFIQHDPGPRQHLKYGVATSPLDIQECGTPTQMSYLHGREDNSAHKIADELYNFHHPGIT